MKREVEPRRKTARKTDVCLFTPAWSQFPVFSGSIRLSLKIAWINSQANMQPLPVSGLLLLSQMCSVTLLMVAGSSLQKNVRQTIDLIKAQRETMTFSGGPTVLGFIFW